jgi:iron complex outermembrane recepter protein
MNSCLKYLIFPVLFFVLNSVFAQNAILSGKVTDEKNESIPGVVVELRNVSDSTMAKVSVTDGNGLYKFEGAKAGTYFLKSSFIGFTPYQSEVLNYDGVSALELKPITMTISPVQLSQVEISAIKPLVEVRADKTVFNVEGSVNSTGSTAYELLQKAPGVVVDNNDNIMLKGRGGVLVQIDGRETRLTQEQLGDYLKSIQSTDVEAIELIANPSSKYEAEGTAGIINIKLKKNKNYGTNGSVTLGYASGKYSKYNTALSVNNRSEKVNLFGSYGNNWGERVNEFYLYREQRPLILDASTIFFNSYFNHNIKGGIDYNLSSKNIIGLMFNGNIRDTEGKHTSRNQIYDFFTLDTDSILRSDQTVEALANTYNFNLNHRFTDNVGHELTTDFDFGYYSGTRNNYQPNVYLLPDNETILSSAINRTITPTTINIYTLKSDYSQNFLQGKIGAGYKISLVNTDNTFDFFNIENGSEILDPERSNRFVYDENVYALYLNYQRSINKFDLQAGIRMENTQSEGNLTTSVVITDENVKRSYTDLFPSTGITFTPNQTHSLALIYSRRIARPNYQELNPFEWKLDELSFRKGNPFLNPQYTDKIELSHTFKYRITTSIGYSYTSDYFAQIADTLPGGKSYLTSRNLATEEVMSANLSVAVQPTKWYNVHLNAGIYNQAYKADFGEGRTLDNSITTFNFYGQNTFKLPYHFTFEVSGWFNTGGVWGGAYVNEPNGALDLGLQKRLFKEQATLRLSYSDILHTAPWASRNVYAGIVGRVHGNWESQMFRASLTWSFGNRQMKSIRQRSTGSETEQKRIGGGE